MRRHPTPSERLLRKLRAATPQEAAQIGPVHQRLNLAGRPRGIAGLFTLPRGKFRPVARPRGLAALLGAAPSSKPFAPAPHAR